MLHTTSRPAVAAALALATTATLTGCGLLGGDDEGGASGSPSATPTAGSTASSTPQSGSTAEESDDNRPRPSKAEVVAGLKKYYGASDKSNSYDHDKLATCIADRGYDKLSSKSLHALKDGKPSDMEKGEIATFAAFAVSCAPDAMPSGSRPPLPTIPNGPKLPSGLPTKLPSGFPTGGSN